MTTPLRSTACVDWEQRIVRGDSLIPQPPLFNDQAEQALQVFKAFRVVDVAGSPEAGEITRQWVLDFVAAIFGAYDADRGERLISEFFLLISKKNSKSTISALIMMVALVLNWRQSAELLILSPTKEAADNCFKPARDAIFADPELTALFHVQDHVRTITHRGTDASLKVVAAENETVTGKKASFVLIDELWLFGKRPNAENMIREAKGGLASRPEGFVIYLSTQSDEPPAGVFASKLRYARGVRDGTIKDASFLPVIYEYPKAMLESKAYLSPENFHVTNPNLGASVSVDYLVRELHSARESGEESLRGFLAKHLNVQVSSTLRDEAWAGARFWTPGRQRLELEEVLARSEVITIGIDGGGLDDLLGVCVLGREGGTGRWLHWARAWMHPIVLERRKSEATRLEGFARDGDLVIVNAMGDDVTEVGDVVEQCEASGVLDQIGVDQAGIGAIVDEITSRGIAHERVLGIPQGWKLMGAIKTTERKLASGEMELGHNPMMRWCVENARTEPRGNAVMITKQASGTAKIDPLMATYNAVALMAMNPKPRRKGFQMFFV